MSEKLFSVGEKLYELWSHRAKKLNNVKESGTKEFYIVLYITGTASFLARRSANSSAAKYEPSGDAKKSSKFELASAYQSFSLTRIDFWASGYFLQSIQNWSWNSPRLLHNEYHEWKSFIFSRNSISKWVVNKWIIILKIDRLK